MAVLVLGHHAGLDVVQAQQPPHGGGGDRVVTGEHHDAQAGGLELADRLRRGRLDGVRDAHVAGQACTHAQVHHRLALLAQRVRGAIDDARVDVRVGEQPGIAQAHVLPGYRAAHALPGDRTEPRHVDESPSIRLRASDDRGGQRMLAQRLQTGGPEQHLRFIESAGGDHDLHRRLAFGQRAGLVDHQRIDLFHQLQRFGILDEHALLRPASDTDGDGDGRCQPERARTRDDEDGHHHEQRIRQRWRGACRRPDDAGQRGDTKHEQHEPACDLIDQLLDRRPRAASFCHQRDDARQQRLGAHTLGTHRE